jgi:hypothetical protein
MTKDKSILTEVVSIRLSKEEKLMLRDLQKKYFFDIFRFIRSVIVTEHSKKVSENNK